jgi:peroxiredoxin
MKRAAALLVFLFLVVSSSTFSQQKPKRIWSTEAQPIVEGLRHLRSVSDEDRGRVTKELALSIRKLPAGKDKSDLAEGLASLSTEGDFGRETLQEVTTTLEAVLRESPAPPRKNGEPNYSYSELASLVRYEYMKATLADPQYTSAMAQLEARDKQIQSADFELKDVSGKTWSLKSMKGKVVLVNFWATWCPPCRKEMPDLQALSDEFGKQGLVVLGLTDEKSDVVKDFLSHQSYNYPILLDTDRDAAKQFAIEGIPKSYVYDRDGKLVAQSIDMRTRAQFKAMLAEAGLK